MTHHDDSPWWLIMMTHHDDSSWCIKITRPNAWWWWWWWWWLIILHHDASSLKYVMNIGVHKFTYFDTWQTKQAIGTAALHKHPASRAASSCITLSIKWGWVGKSKQCFHPQNNKHDTHEVEGTHATRVNQSSIKEQVQHVCRTNWHSTQCS